MGRDWGPSARFHDDVGVDSLLPHHRQALREEGSSLVGLLLPASHLLHLLPCVSHSLRLLVASENELNSIWQKITSDRFRCHLVVCYYFTL